MSFEICRNCMYLVHHDPGKAHLTPVWPPRVSHVPIFHSILHTPTNNLGTYRWERDGYHAHTAHSNTNMLLQALKSSYENWYIRKSTRVEDLSYQITQICILNCLYWKCTLLSFPTHNSNSNSQTHIHSQKKKRQMTYRNLMIDKCKQFPLWKNPSCIFLQLRGSINSTTNRTSGIDFCLHFVSSSHRSIVTYPVCGMFVYRATLCLHAELYVGRKRWKRTGKLLKTVADF